MKTSRRHFIITTYGSVGFISGFHAGCEADVPPATTPAPVTPPPSPASADPIAQMRATVGAAPMETVKLTDNLVMLSGPGGNVAVLHGADGKILVDTFVKTVWDKLKQTVDQIGSAPIESVIDSHWHFDHTDNNQNFRQGGADIIAHENTKKRLSETHDLLGMHFTPAPAEALPTQTFATAHTLTANGEGIELTYVPPAHTDSDIFIHFAKANVMHVGDVFFNGIYPFIDQGTGGSINGMISGAERAIKMVDANTRIIPGHGPLADRAALGTFRDMMVTVRDRVQKLKSSGRTLEDTIAAKPTKDLDGIWGKGFLPPDNFVTIVYSTL